MALERRQPGHWGSIVRAPVPPQTAITCHTSGRREEEEEGGGREGESESGRGDRKRRGEERG